MINKHFATIDIKVFSNVCLTMIDVLICNKNTQSSSKYVFFLGATTIAHHLCGLYCATDCSPYVGFDDIYLYFA